MGTLPHACVWTSTPHLLRTRRFRRGLPKLCASPATCAARDCSKPLARSTQVRLVGSRLGRYEVLALLVLLFGSASSGARTLPGDVDRLPPCAEPFMALFERGTLPPRSTRRRVLAASASSCLPGRLADGVYDVLVGGGVDAADGRRPVGPVGPA